MKLLKFLRPAVLIGTTLIALAIAPYAHATLEQSLAEEARLKEKIATLTQQVKAQEARVAKLSAQAKTSQGTAAGKEGMGGNVDLAEGLGVALDTGTANSAEDVLKGLNRQLSRAQSSLTSVQGKIARARNQGAQEAQANADAAAKAKLEADAVKLAKAKAEAEAKARADEQARLAQAQKDAQSDRNKARDDTGSHQKDGQEKYDRDRARLKEYADKYRRILENYRDNPDPELRAKLETAKKKILAKKKRLDDQKEELSRDDTRDPARAASRDAAKSSMPKCFIAGTPVQTPSGCRNIEDLKTGDTVLSFSQRTGRVEPAVVLRTWKSQRADLVQLCTPSGSLSCSRNHRFYTSQQRWVPSTALRSDERILRLDADHEPGKLSPAICKVTTVSLRAPVNVYNLTVANNSNYFVGPDALLCHNTK